MNPMPTVIHNGEIYKLRSRKVQVPDLAGMDNVEALVWLLRNTYPRGTNNRAPRPNLAGLTVTVR